MSDSEGQERAWLSVVVSEELKLWVRIKAASTSKSTSAYIRELVEVDRRRTEKGESVKEVLDLVSHTLPKLEISQASGG